jgi:hypothetical protein
MAKFQVTQVGLLDLIDNIKKGSIRIPNFQRDFVWTPNQIKALLDSIRKGIPLGAIFTWDVPANYTSLFDQYLSSKDQLSGGWHILEDIDQDAPLWHVKHVAHSKISPKSAFSISNTSSFEGIIDGRQRSQSLLMTLGGVCFAHQQNKHAKVWYLDLNKYLNHDEIPFSYVKSKETIQGGAFDSLGKWIDKGYYPLWWADPASFTAQLTNSTHYTSGSLPTNLTIRLQTLSKWSSLLASCDIAKITISNNVDLSMVCEVFETLNEAGTKVSAFDIVHANLLGDSNGKVDLKDRLGGYSDENVNGHNPGLKAWTVQKNNWKNLSQGITLAYCLSLDIRSKFPSNKPSNVFNSVKGEAMIATPYEFYAELLDIDHTTGQDVAGYPFHNVMENICYDFHLVTRGNAGPANRWCPSPILFSLYLALRLQHHFRPTIYSLDSLNDAFRAYYWRAVGTSLYDQGYLTMVYSHGKNISKFLEANNSVYQSSINTWWDNYRNEIESFTTPARMPDKVDLINALKDPKVAGTTKKMLLQALFTFAPRDLQTGNPVYKLDSQYIELHHIFPRNWITNNISNPDLRKMKECVAVLVPMENSSNNQWRSMAPDVALQNWALSNSTLKSICESLAIPTSNQECLDCLQDSAMNSEQRFEVFITKRADYLADKIIELAKCDHISSFPSF